MGTRGAFGFKVDGQYKLSFTQWDGGMGIRHHINYCLAEAFKKISIDEAKDNVRKVGASEVEGKFISVQDFILPALMGELGIVNIEGRSLLAGRWGWLHLVDFDKGKFISDDMNTKYERPLTYYLPDTGGGLGGDPVKASYQKLVAKFGPQKAQRIASYVKKLVRVELGKVIPEGE